MPTTSNTRTALHWVLRILLATLFLVSAIAKLFSIDDFELYIYSFGLLSLNNSFLAARICIGIEISLALLIATGWWQRTVTLLATLLLLLFTLFLCYAALIGRTDSCHCMGRWINMPPSISLLKNALLIALALLYMRLPLHRCNRPWKGRTWVATVVVIASFATVFCISVPDNWMFGPEETRFDRALLQETLTERGHAEGHQLVALVTPGCPYCRMTREKLHSIALRHHIDESQMLFLEPDDIGTERFLRITYGQRPLVVLTDNGCPSTTYHYRNISERQICTWLASR